MPYAHPSHRPIAAALRCPVAFALLLANAAAPAATFQVTSNADDGAGSLRAAIVAANGTAASDLITFNLAAGQRTIQLVTSLPTVTAELDIDGTSQPGYAGVPLVRIDGVALSAGQDALRIDANSSTVRGLMITRAPGSGVMLLGGLGNTVHSMYLGTDGSTALGNGTGVHVGSTALNTIGLNQSGKHNVISGNVDNGIYLGGDANYNQIFNNRIGTNAAGTAAIPNGYAGIRSFGDENAIGDVGANAGNLISGNGRFGIELGGGENTLVYGNRIGTDLAGNAALGNGETGIDDAGSNTRIGAAAANAGNLISGNAGTGLLLTGSGSRVAGNRIGTNAGATAAVPNGYVGIRVFGSFVEIGAAGFGNVISGNVRYGIEIGAGAHDVAIGHNRIGTNAAGTAAIPNLDDGITTNAIDVVIGGAGAGNLISGNEGSGISIDEASAGLSILANRIGTSADGMSALGNDQYGVRVFAGSGLVLGAPGLGNLVSGNGRGIIVGGAPALIQGNVVGLDATQGAALGNDEYGMSFHSPDHQIGGRDAGEGNVIAANSSSGLRFNAGGDRNRVEGNVLGSNAAGTHVFGNGYSNVFVYRADANRIGGTAPGAGNVLRGAQYGVFVDLGTGNAILGNSIDGHEQSGIELTPIGPEHNDAGDADHGPNEGQNRPVLTSALAQGGDVLVGGQLASMPGAQYRIEFFHSDTCHASGLGEVAHFLGAIPLTTDAGGVGEISHTLANPHGAGAVSATATDADGNTSEISPCIAIGAPGPGTFQLWRDPFLAYEDLGRVTIHVIRAGGLAGNSSVRVRTQDDSATAPADYAARDTVLQFADGEWLQSIEIPLVPDGTEGDENFRVELLSPTGGAMLGTNADADVILFDHDDALPFLHVEDVSVTEPDSGQAMATFVLQLSPTDHVVQLDYFTSDGTADAGSDYTATSGTISFQPGETSKPVSVPVHADGLGEGDETFHLHVDGLAGDFIASDTDAQGVIVDADDSAAIFRDGFE